MFLFQPFLGERCPIFRLAHVKLIQARQTMCYRNGYRESWQNSFSTERVKIAIIFAFDIEWMS